MAKRSEVERPWLRGGEQEAPERAPERERGEERRERGDEKHAGRRGGHGDGARAPRQCLRTGGGAHR